MVISNNVIGVEVAKEAIRVATGITKEVETTKMAMVAMVGTTKETMVVTKEIMVVIIKEEEEEVITRVIIIMATIIREVELIKEAEVVVGDSTNANIVHSTLRDRIILPICLNVNTVHRTIIPEFYYGFDFNGF